MDVKKVAQLANLPLNDDELLVQEKNLHGVMELVDHIQKLNTDRQPTAQVTGKINATRVDEIDTSRILPQAEALSNAADSFNGFFKVKAIFEE